MDNSQTTHSNGIGRVESTSIIEEMQRSYLDYAMSVIVSRALPDVRDGLKPVQRRIVYAMQQQNLHHTSRYQKSAAVVGEVLKNFHPHGDIPVYDAMVRMAQDFSMRYPLVDGQGNFGCFTGDTKVRLTDGRILSFKELINEQSKGRKHWTFSFNHQLGKIEIAEIKNPRLTRIAAELVEVELDNGEKIKCTPDHRFMLRDGSYREAQSLHPGDSLMPLYHQVYDGAEDKNLAGYERIMQPLEGLWQFTHHLADEWNLNHQVYAKNTGRVHHHVDFNKLNNNPANVIRLQWEDHWKVHYELASWRHKNDPEYAQKLAAGRQKFIAENHQRLSSRASARNRQAWQDQKYRQHMVELLRMMWLDKDYKAKMSQASSQRLKKLWQSEDFRQLLSHQKSLELKQRWQDPTYKQQVVKSKVLGYVAGLLQKYSQVTPRVYEQKRTNNGVPKIDRALEFFGDFPMIVEQAQTYNHKVVRVTCLLEREDVYDLTIDSLHNFALSAGIFVHNSVDGDSPAAMRYCLTGDTLVATNHGLRQIQDLSPKDSENLQIKVLSRNRVVNQTSKWFDSGVHPTIKITTHQGLTLQGTHNHPMLIWTKNTLTGKPEYQWKTLERVQPGDVAVVDRTSDLLWPSQNIPLKTLYPRDPHIRTQIKKLPKTLTVDLAYLLGALLSEGSVSAKKIEFCNSDKAWVEDFERRWRRVFPDCRLHKFFKQPSSWGKKTYFRLEVHSLYVIEFLKNLGLEPVRAAAKEIPKLILQSPKNVVASFLRSYFEGDGSISSASKMVELSAISISEGLISTFQILLLRFGIVSTKRFDSYRSTHKLYLRGLKNYQQFQNEIGFVSDRKRSKLATIIKGLQKDQSIFDYVPFLRDYVLANIDTHIVYNQRQFATKHNFDRYSNLALNQKQTSNLVIPTLKIEIQQLFEHLLKNNYVFDQIVSVEDGGWQNVYSVKVDSDCHSFVGNGFINHNTEARLSSIADELLRDINKNTVDFIDNYSGTVQEPTLLPSVIPNLLLNGASGIAVGMATQIPPHNLGEVTEALLYMIDHPTKDLPATSHLSEKELNQPVSASDGREILEQLQTAESHEPVVGSFFRSEASVEDLIKIVKGPDFPTGASIYDQSEILAAYASGKGRIVMRAKAEIEETRGGRFDIIVTELPYQVNKAVLIAKIADLVRDKKLDGISDLRDESDRKGMRMVIELKRDAKPQSVLNNLYKHTALQSVFNVNMVALAAGVPRLMTLKHILEEFINHRVVIVRRRTEFELAEARAREHILEGLKIAVDNIDEVIETIRRSADADAARVKLMTRFKLSEIQATAILDMQLRRLAALERKKILDELKMIRELIAYLADLLSNPKKILKVIKDELQQVKDKYADDRRTRVYKQKVGEFSEEDLVADETTIVTVTKGGYVKRQSPMSFRTQNRGGKGISGITTKEEDAVSHIFYTQTLDNLLFFTDKGRVFQIKVWEIPEASRTAKGQAIVNLINTEPGEKMTAILTTRVKDRTKFLFMGTRKGSVKKTPVEEYANIRKNGLISIKLDPGDELCWVAPTNGNQDVIMITREGQSIRFSETQVRPTHRDTSGVRGIMLSKSDEIVSLNLITDVNNDVLVVMENGLGKKTKISAWKRQSRGGSGIKAAQITSKTGKIVTAQIIGGEVDTLVMTSNKGQLIKLHLKDVPTLQRQTQGVILMRVRTGEVVAAAAVVSSKDSNDQVVKEIDSKAISVETSE